MIRVEIRRASDHSICGFTVTGHAAYDVPGKDIVCSAVSAVTIGTVNAVEALLRVDLNPKAERGYLQAEVPAAIDPVIVQQLQMLLESMIVMLRGIESSYASYMEIIEIKI